MEERRSTTFFLMMQKIGFDPSKAAYDKIMELLLAEDSTDLALKSFETCFTDRVAYIGSLKAEVLLEYLFLSFFITISSVMFI
jgi:hypothetical protein